MGGKPRAPSAARLPSVRIRATVRVRAGAEDGPLTIDAPRPFVDALGSLARAAVRGRLGGAAFVSALVPLGGRLRLILSPELVAASGVYDGARATLELERIIDPAVVG